MSKLAALAAAAIVAALFAAYWLFAAPQSGIRDRTADIEKVARTNDAASLTNLLSKIDPASSTQRRARDARAGKTPAHPFPAVPKTRQGLPLKDDPFGAASIAEQAWLDRNGYPNKAQWELYSQASDTALRQAADAGDSVAKVMLDNRNLIAGNMTAQEELLASAVDGSGFALDMYASVMAGSRAHGNPETAYVLSRVAEMRGNYGHALTRDMMLPQLPGQLQRLQWDAEAIRLFGALNGMHFELYGKHWVDPRPMEIKRIK